MPDDLKLSRKLPDQPKEPELRRPSLKRVMENIDRWANSPGLQPPTLPTIKSA